MKIVIDIPKETWERIKDGYVPLGISKYLSNGTPLDKIKAEIEKDAFTDVNNSKFISVNRVNQIIDKYKAESEDAE